MQVSLNAAMSVASITFHSQVLFMLLLSARGGFVKHLSLTWVAQQSVTKIISLTFISLVTPKAGAKH